MSDLCMAAQSHADKLKTARTRQARHFGPLLRCHPSERGREVV